MKSERLKKPDRRERLNRPKRLNRPAEGPEQMRGKKPEKSSIKYAASS